MTVSTRDRVIGNLLDRWEMTPNDLKQEMREHGCGKQLDELLRHVEAPSPQPNVEALRSRLKATEEALEIMITRSREVTAELVEERKSRSTQPHNDHKDRQT